MAIIDYQSTQLNKNGMCTIFVTKNADFMSPKLQSCNFTRWFYQIVNVDNETKIGMCTFFVKKNHEPEAENVFSRK